MQIPSQFRQTSLYPESRSRSGSVKSPSRGGISGHWRRTFRLVLALVVILVVMRKASDPSLYQVFFPSNPVVYAPSGQPDSPRENIVTASDQVDQQSGNASNGQMNSSESKGTKATFASATMEQALATVVDGATWRSGDKTALQLLRRESSLLRDDDAINVNVLALLQQPETYFGNVVRVRGRVARCDSVEDYYQLWLKPIDGSNRPIIAIVNEVPERFEQIDGKTEAIGPPVTIVAKFLKRLAYRSAKGADVSPVVVGRVSLVPSEYLEANEVDLQRTPAGDDGVRNKAIALLLMAGVLGVVLAGVLVRRSTKQRSLMRRRRQLSQSKRLELPSGMVLIAACLFAQGAACVAESVLPSLGKFDRPALESVFPVGSQTDEVGSHSSDGEMAKLLFQINRLEKSSFRAESKQPLNVTLGDAVNFRGNVISRRTHAVPSSLVAYLEFSRFYSLHIQSSDSADDASLNTASTSVVIVSDLPSGLALGDRVEGVGVSVLGKSLEDQSLGIDSAVVAPRVKWFPKSTDSQGWELLRQSGFDLSLIDVIRGHSRQQLAATENEAFFSMLAASRVASTESRVPKRVPVIDLLSRSTELTGDWLRMEAEALRVTRIEVGSAAAGVSPRLDADHYFQIDAIGDLGNVVVKIEPSKPGGAPLEMDGRYPISIVTTKLPAELAALASEPGGPSDRRPPIVFDALFYRLWSYSSDLSSRDPRSSDQIGPLLFATDMRVPRPSSSDSVGVRRIGWIICASLIVGFVLILWWNHRVKKMDEQARRPEAPVQIVDLSDS